MKLAPWRVCGFFACICSGLAQAPTQFYLTASVNTDTEPFHSDFILDVSPEGADVHVRYIRIGPLGGGCSRTTTVKAVNTQIQEAALSKIIGTNNPCSVSPDNLSETLSQYPKKDLMLSSVRFGIVAMCGGNEVVLDLPERQRIDLDRLRQDAPTIARLWSLWDEVEVAVFGGSSPFTEKDVELQQAGAAIVPDLMAGKFNKGFVDKSVENDLSDYRGPVKPGDFTAQLMNAETYQFASYVSPMYPEMAKLSNVHGRVMLEAAVDVTSGEVRGVTALNGDALVTQAAIDAARRWRFVPGTVTSQPIHAVLDFAWRCP